MYMFPPLKNIQSGVLFWWVFISLFYYEKIYSCRCFFKKKHWWANLLWWYFSVGVSWSTLKTPQNGNSKKIALSLWALFLCESKCYRWMSNETNISLISNWIFTPNLEWVYFYSSKVIVVSGWFFKFEFVVGAESPLRPSQQRHFCPAKHKGCSQADPPGLKWAKPLFHKITLMSPGVDPKAPTAPVLQKMWNLEDTNGVDLYFPRFLDLDFPFRCSK